ncbi:hypothetical protein OEC43_002718 [Salmonella enterica subsp. enterica serovar Johannesburg]|nr:hypothetical protein [Enterobacter hormaechei]EAS2530972.1 hypothetical protein [Salmonella enterica]EBA9638333.1 hypothetical protein [Salmonella enterica subsp. enterica serovar Johannesburg]EBD8054634.1 hypothetical protein [Salmonella enterica subsp. enterica serovar Johannesburg]EBH5305760.1 hypothetical protein [Salmonella enterica subsp. enterica serovar Johannesburg]ECC5540081.1 hypothetical protein [Salmonella enterica]
MIFNGEMVRAILDGRKTQTRRVMKVQPSDGFHPTHNGYDLDLNAHWYTPGVVDKNGYLQPAKKYVFGVADENEGYACPFGAVGDRIWVRETFSPVPDHEEPAGCSAILYAADGNGPYGKWVPSIHMPRWASRITLEITGVRVERLNSISDSDASKEGCCIADMESGDCLSDVFARLWTSIYGDESWKVNPWVWVIEFKVVPNVQDNPA